MSTDDTSTKLGPPVQEAPGLPPPRSARGLTALARDTIATQLVSGLTYSEIARLHNLTPEQVKSLAGTANMQTAIEERREHMMAAGSRLMFKWLLHADRLADDQLTCALTPGPDQYRARTWILEKVSPTRHVSQSEVTVNHNVHHEVMVGLKDALVETAKVLEIRPDQSGIALLEGKSAMPPVDFAMDDETH